MTEGEPTSISGRAPTARKKTSGLRRRSRAGHCTWRPTRGTSGNALYAMLGLTSTDTPGGTYTVRRQSGRSTASARRIWLVYTPTPAQGRANPMPSTATCKPVTALTKVRLVPLQHLEVLQGQPGAADDRGLRVVGDHGRDAGVHRQVAIDIPELRPTTRQHEPAIENVGRQLRRRFLEHASYRADDKAERFLERFGDVV